VVPETHKGKFMRSEGKRPENLAAKAIPTEGYVLSVDGKLKTRYDSAEAAFAAATKLKQSYPVIQAAVYDAVAHTYTTVEADGPQIKSDEKKEETPG
jgi:hypothetical protein